MVLFSDIEMHGFEVAKAAVGSGISHFESDKKSEAGRPEWTIEHKYIGQLREASMLKIMHHVKTKQAWVQRIHFDGVVSGPKEIQWLLKSVGYSK